MTYSTYKIPEDERIRQECEARERYLLKEKAAKKKERAYKKTKKENEKLKQQLAQANSEVDLQFIQIPDHHIQLTRIHPGRRLYDCI
ncbi:MAG: hypothetical protein J6M27_03035, partial [Lachnospiraceae bacterium]|nr:hypothetical protein [Lachnospiraceae bacterium]